MSVAPRRVFWFCITSIVSLSIILAGCSGGNAPTPLSTGASQITPGVTTSPTPVLLAASSPTPTPTPAVSEIVSNVVAAMDKMASYEYEMDATMNLNMEIEGKKMDMVLTITGTGAHNITTREMKLDATMDITSLPGQGKISMPVVGYMMNGWQYTRVSIPMAGEQWVKMRVEPGSYEADDEIGHCLDLLNSAKDITLAGTETVDGVSCYVLKVDPSPAELARWMASFLKSANTPVSGLEDTGPADFFKDISIKSWIDRDSFRLKKSFISTSINIEGAALDDSSLLGDGVYVDLSQTTILNSYNQAVTITLPPEAINAADAAYIK